MNLSIANLAIPCKRAVTHQTPTYTLNSTSATTQLVNANMTGITPITQGGQVIRYHPRAYEGKPPDAPSMAEYLCYADVYTNNNSSLSIRTKDITKGRLLYYTYVRDTIDSYNVYGIRCDRPDGTSFDINPGYYLGTGLYCVGVSFWCFRCGGTQYVEGQGLAPSTKETRTLDGLDLEVALAPGLLDITVKIDVYNRSRDEVTERLVDSIDSDSYMGRGGLYTYYLCGGVDYKNKYTAQIDPSGHWYTETKNTKENIDLSISWT